MLHPDLSSLIDRHVFEAISWPIYIQEKIFRPYSKISRRDFYEASDTTHELQHILGHPLVQRLTAN